MKKIDKDFIFLESVLLKQLLNKEKNIDDFRWFVDLSNYKVNKGQNKKISLANSLKEVFHYVDPQILYYLNEQPTKRCLSNVGKIVFKKNPRTILKRKIISFQSAVCVALDFITDKGFTKIKEDQRKDSIFIIPFLLKPMKNEDRKLFCFSVFNSSDWDRPKIQIHEKSEVDFSRILLKENVFFLVPEM